MIIQFGKFKGCDLEDIPSSYLRWAAIQTFVEHNYPNLLSEIESELEYRDKFDRHFEED